MISFDRGLSVFQGKRRGERGTRNQAGKENRSKTYVAKRDEKGRQEEERVQKREAGRARASERDIRRGLRKKSKKLTELCTEL